MVKQKTPAGAPAGAFDAGWKALYAIGGSAALLAGIVFRRNLGVEVSLFVAQQPPESAADWFALLQANRLLGLAYLAIFDVVNYALVALMLLALVAVLWRANKSLMAVAGMLGFLGIAAYFASNTALSLLALSDQYALAASEAERLLLLAAGQSLLALNRFGMASAHPGSGGYLSLLFVAAAGLITALVMLRSGLFSKLAAWVGIAAAGLDLAYCLAFLLVPASAGEHLPVLFLPLAGLLYMVWHIMVGWRLVRLGRTEGKAVASLQRSVG